MHTFLMVICVVGTVQMYGKRKPLPLYADFLIGPTQVQTNQKHAWIMI